MGWEERRGRSYYYRSRRIGGRVVKEYVGCGSGAELMAEIEEATRQVDRQRRELERAERGLLEEQDAEIGAVCKEIDLIAKAVLISAGYRQHKRGEWRHKRAR